MKIKNSYRCFIIGHQRKDAGSVRRRVENQQYCFKGTRKRTNTTRNLLTNENQKRKTFDDETYNK